MFIFLVQILYDIFFLFIFFQYGELCNENGDEYSPTKLNWTGDGIIDVKTGYSHSGLLTNN